METDGTSGVMTIIQVFTQLFLQAHQNENQQVSQDLVVFFSSENMQNFARKETILCLREVTEYNEVNNSIPL